MSTWTLNQQLTLIETAKREHWGEALPIAEILHQSRPMLQHAPIVEANEFFSNVALQRFKLPAGSFRVLNFGVPTEMSQVKQIRDQIGILESYAEHDKKLVDSQPNPTKFRNDENVAFIEGLGQTISYTLFYGNAILTPEKWTGLAPRMASLNSTTIQGCGYASTYASSLYLVDWGPRQVALMYPRGSQAGLQYANLGEDTSTDAYGNKHQIYRDHYEWLTGLVVYDPRRVGRVANINCDITTAGNEWDEDVFIRVKTWMRDGGKSAIGYVSTNVYAQILIKIKDKGNVWHTMQDPFGSGEVPALLGSPIYLDETILETETYIS